jgi:hypothetical protein
MWLFTQNAFLSVVSYDPTKDSPNPAGGPDDLLVRARVRTDLESLKKYVPGLKLNRDDSADYMFRAVMTREQWATCMVGEIGEIDYSNFKDRVAERQGHDRAGIYMQIWSALLALQPPSSS